MEMNEKRTVDLLCISRKLPKVCFINENIGRYGMRSKTLNNYFRQP